jgi:hypothetical protein
VKIVISLCVLFHVSEPFIQRRTYEDELMWESVLLVSFFSKNTINSFERYSTEILIFKIFYSNVDSLFKSNEFIRGFNITCFVCFSLLLFKKNNTNSFVSDLAQNIHLQDILFYVCLFFRKNEYTRGFNITFLEYYLITPKINKLVKLLFAIIYIHNKV